MLLQRKSLPNSPCVIILHVSWRHCLLYQVRRILVSLSLLFPLFLVKMASFTTEAFSELAVGLTIIGVRTGVRLNLVGIKGFQLDDYLMLVAAVCLAFISCICSFLKQHFLIQWFTGHIFTGDNSSILCWSMVVWSRQQWNDRCRAISFRSIISWSILEKNGFQDSNGRVEFIHFAFVDIETMSLHLLLEISVSGCPRKPLLRNQVVQAARNILMADFTT